MHQQSSCGAERQAECSAWFTDVHPGLLTNRTSRDFLSHYTQAAWPQLVRLGFIHAVLLWRELYEGRWPSVAELQQGLQSAHQSLAWRERLPRLREELDALGQQLQAFREDLPCSPKAAGGAARTSAPEIPLGPAVVPTILQGCPPAAHPAAPETLSSHPQGAAPVYPEWWPEGPTGSRTARRGRCSQPRLAYSVPDGLPREEDPAQDDLVTSQYLGVPSRHAAGAGAEEAGGKENAQPKAGSGDRQSHKPAKKAGGGAAGARERVARQLARAEALGRLRRKATDAAVPGPAAGAPVGAPPVPLRAMAPRQQSRSVFEIAEEAGANPWVAALLQGQVPPAQAAAAPPDVQHSPARTGGLGAPEGFPLRRQGVESCSRRQAGQAELAVCPARSEGVVSEDDQQQQDGGGSPQKPLPAQQRASRWVGDFRHLDSPRFTARKAAFWAQHWAEHRQEAALEACGGEEGEEAALQGGAPAEARPASPSPGALREPCCSASSSSSGAAESGEESGSSTPLPGQAASTPSETKAGFQSPREGGQAAAVPAIVLEALLRGADSELGSSAGGASSLPPGGPASELDTEAETIVREVLAGVATELSAAQPVEDAGASPQAGAEETHTGTTGPESSSTASLSHEDWNEGGVAALDSPAGMSSQRPPEGSVAGDAEQPTGSGSLASVGESREESY